MDLRKYAASNMLRSVNELAPSSKLRFFNTCNPGLKKDILLASQIQKCFLHTRSRRKSIKFRDNPKGTLAFRFDLSYFRKDPLVGVIISGRDRRQADCAGPRNIVFRDFRDEVHVRFSHTFGLGLNALIDSRP